MAFEVVNPLACFWRKAGLRNLLFNAPPEKEAPGRSSAPEKAAQNFGNVPRYSRSKATVEQPAPLARESARPTAAASAWQPLQPSRLPPAWQARLAKTRPGFAAWTYAELAQDLEAGQQDDIAIQARQLRRNFLQALIQALRQPAGTHTFWPTRVLVEGSPEPDADAFWSGLDHLGSRILFVFGKQALKDCDFPDSNPLAYRKCLVYRLDDINKLATMPKGRETALAFMQGAFRTAGPRR